MFEVWCDFGPNDFKFPTECASERISKIGQYLARRGKEYDVSFFDNL